MDKLKGIKVAILVANGFEQVEMEEPRQALEQAGAQTFLISPEKDSVQGWNKTERGDGFPVDIPLSRADTKNYDAVLLPGGVINPDHLRTIPEAIAFIKTMHAENKPIAAICHGPWLLINAELVKGRKMTSWSSIKMDLTNAGAQWLDEAVVCDNNILTSRKPEDIAQFNEAIIQLFQA